MSIFLFSTFTDDKIGGDGISEFHISWDVSWNLQITFFSFKSIAIILFELGLSPGLWVPSK